MDLINYGEENTVLFKIVDSSGNYVEGQTFPAGDIQISRDGGVYSNVTNSPTEVGRGTYSLVLTTTESTANTVVLDIIDQDTTKAFLDVGLKLYTMGASSGFIQFQDYQIDVSGLDSKIDSNGTLISSVLEDTGTSLPNQLNSIDSNILNLHDFDPTTDQVIVGTNNDKSGYTLSGVIQTLDALENISVSDIMNTTTEGAETLVQAIRLMRAVLVGKSVEGGTIFRDAEDLKDRVIATLDNNNNRVEIITDAE